MLSATGCDLFELVDSDGDGCIDKKELDIVCSDSPEVERTLVLFYQGIQEGREIDIDIWLRYVHLTLLAAHSAWV